DDPERGTWHNSLGFLLANAGRVAEAEECYRQATYLDPLRPQATINLVQLLLGQHRVADAEQAMAVLLAGAPADVTTRLQLAGVFQRAAQLEIAAGLVQEVLRIDPQN